MPGWLRTALSAADKVLFHAWVTRFGNATFLAGAILFVGDRALRVSDPLTIVGIVLMAIGLVRGGHQKSVDKGTGHVDPGSRQLPARPQGVDASSAPGYLATLVKASGTNDGQFPRFESASDSLGHVAERLFADHFGATTEQVLRPGQRVTIELAVSDPNGDDVEISVIAPAGAKADLAISADGVLTWNVRDEDIGDPAHVHIYMLSQRSYHRHQRWDDVATFTYRVLPRA